MSRIFFCTFLLLLYSSLSIAQNTYLPADNFEVNHLLDRLETKYDAFSNQLFLSNKGVARKDVYDFLATFRASGYRSKKTYVDDYNIFKSLSENGEWESNDGDGAAVSKYALGPFYKRQQNMLYVNKRHFFFVLNPILGLNITSEQNPNEKALWSAVEGLQSRGRLGNILGFSFSLTNNNLQAPTYETQYIERWEAIPGAESYHHTAKGYQYLQFEGNLDVSLIKDHVSLDVGYGRHFIGDGIRTLLLSDFAGNNFYVGINTKIWHLNFQNLYLRLEPQSFSGEPSTIGHKYAAIQYLSMNLRPWLNLGLFESVTFSRNGGYELSYLNPIMLNRATERDLGSPDKISLGINAKAIVAHRFNFYGQFMLNEFTAKYFFKRSGYWANKWGAQLGFKYFDVFTIHNLDIQAEVNMVRPYTFAHSLNQKGLPISNFTSWNKPMAHPLGAGFREIIGNINYQPFPKWTINVRAMIYQQGVDTGGLNLGNNIFETYEFAKRGNKNFGVRMINGPKAQCMMFNLNLNYELKSNLYLFAGGTYRKYSVAENLYPEEKDLFFNVGFRLNLAMDFQNWY